ncbi:apolipoprotein F [Elgaria multicarinata webbii]|uniref:apolipoprotein F n=1 Tax=Elgaria multicarinata webbii TaxID=159646 RepID=UPI002FCD4603
MNTRENKDLNKRFDMHLPSPAVVLTFLGLLHHGLEGHFLPKGDLRDRATEAHQSTSDSSPDPLRTLLSSISSKSPQPQLPAKGISCEDLMPDALGDFANLPQKSQNIIRAALTLALQGAGCSQHAETQILQLHKELGQESADDLLLMLAGALGTADSPGESNKSVALHFNLDQLGPLQARHCQGLMRVNGSALQGQVHGVYGGFQEAAAACQRLGDSCAGVASDGTGSFQVVDQAGSYFLPCNSTHSWLHQCHRLARFRRSTGCLSKKEEDVHSVVEWIPAVSTYYNLGSSIYYAAVGCTDLAKDRALEGVMDIGYDALVAMTGGAGTVVRVAAGAAIKPAYKDGMRRLISLFTHEEPYPVPTSYSGPVTII